MSDPDSWLRFVLVTLATWRLTHLLAREDGPADLIYRLRETLGDGLLGRLMDCFYCLSLWIAAPMALLLVREPLDLPIAWLALSGAAVLLERLSDKGPEQAPPLQTTEDRGHGMLWSETAMAPPSNDTAGAPDRGGPAERP